MSMSSEEISSRVEKFENSFIPHDTLKSAKAALRDLHGRYRPKGQPRLKARAILLLGNSGAGKSTVLESYKSDHPDTEVENTDVRHVVLVEAPKRTTPRQLAAAILNTLSPGQRIKDSWNTDRILTEICMLCEELSVAMLLIDEAHHIVDHRNEEAKEDAAEFIKSLLNRSGSQVVLCGLPHLDAELASTKKLDQLRRRIKRRILLSPYNWAKPEGHVAFRALLGRFEQNLALPQRSGLSDVDFAVRIYCATRGEVGLVSKELSSALEHALKTGARRLDLKIMGELWAEPTESAREEDPFLLEFDAVPIDPTPNVAKSTNPYLASTKEFRTLWNAMAGSRMRDTSPKTSHRRKAPAVRDPLAP